MSINHIAKVAEQLKALHDSEAKKLAEIAKVATKIKAIFDKADEDCRELRCQKNALRRKWYRQNETRIALNKKLRKLAGNLR